MGNSGSYRLHHSQNFIRRASLVERLVHRAGIGHDDVVIDIGAGGGVLTAELAKRAGQVIAIEQDAQLVSKLGVRFREVRNVCVFAHDALQFPMPHTPYKIFANIPFRDTSAIVGNLTTGAAPPDDIWLIVQKEAAERYLPGDRMTMIALTLAPWFEVSIEHRFDRRDFRPAPRVDSVLLRMRHRDQPLIGHEHRERFTWLVESVFSAWQPTIGKALGARLPRRAARSVIETPGLDLARRPSFVDIGTWIAIYNVLDARDDDRVWDALRRSSDTLHRQQSSLDRPTRTPTRGRSPRSG